MQEQRDFERLSRPAASAESLSSTSDKVSPPRVSTRANCPPESLQSTSGGFSERVDRDQHVVKKPFLSVKRLTEPHAKDDSLQDLQNLKSLRSPDPRLSHARHMGDYQMWLQFADGRAGIVDFSDDLWGEDLEPLRDRLTFEEIKFDEGLATLSWERGGIDISPSYLYSKLESVQ